MGNVGAGLKAKSPALVPEKAMAVMLRSAPPELVMVKVCGALGVPFNCEANVRVGVGVVAKCGAMPVPFSVTACGLALLVMLRVAVSAPSGVLLGVKISGTVVVPLGATVIGLACVGLVKLPGKAKSAKLVPLMLRSEICNVPKPVLVMVTVIGLLGVLSSWLPNWTGLGTGADTRYNAGAGQRNGVDTLDGVIGQA